MKYLMICEKPSLMRECKACYMNHKDEIEGKIGEIEFVALAGHICGYYEPDEYDEWADLKWDKVDYPMIPTEWGIKMINNAYNQKTMKQIREFGKEVDGYIVGTDSDAEGYGIYYLLENYLKITSKKALRFVEHSLTDSEILDSFLAMTDYHTDEVHKHFTQSFVLRSRADWLYGMNGTRMMSVKTGEIMTVGRVKAPTIKLVYDNCKEIDNFKPRNYYLMQAKYETFNSFLTEDKKNPKKFDKEEEMPNVPLEGTVVEKVTSRTSSHAPQLYDLPAIQTEASSEYKYNPSETLEILQSLYEKHKVISYPRAQCRFVSYEKSKEFPEMLKKMSVFEDLKPYAEIITNDDIKRVMGDKKVVNDAEVEKESHDALLPTSETPNLEKMSEKEKNICHMIYKRLLAQFLPALIEDKTQMLIKHGDFYFIAKGKIVIEQGWKNLYKQSKDSVIPNIEKDEKINAEEMIHAKKTTTPPKRLNQGTLLHTMEHIDTIIPDKELKKTMAESKGLGTPATRAAIISDIIERKYVEEKKDGLYITELGKRYIEAVSSLDIVSPIFAAKLDIKIKKVQRGEEEFDEVYEDTIDNLNAMCNQIDDIPDCVKTTDVECINCGAKLKIGRYSYECPNCSVRVPKILGENQVDEKMLQLFMDGKTTGVMTIKGKEKTFPARCYYSKEENKIKYNFDSGISCPICNKENIKLNKGGAFCDCGFKLFRNMRGHMLNDKEIVSLIDGKTLKSVSMKKKDGSKFTANVSLDEKGETKFSWDN